MAGSMVQRLVTQHVCSIAFADIDNWRKRRFRLLMATFHQALFMVTNTLRKRQGITLNGMLAAKYERVCGHKGYSFDSFQHNERRRNGSDVTQGLDSVSKLRTKHNRGRVPPTVMEERGFEDCDWISLETSWGKWKEFLHSPLPFQLHVPCREPIEHLLSQCNMMSRSFDCSSDDLQEEVRRCMVYPDRFDKGLEVLASQHNNTFSLKCFNNDKTFTNYMDLMDKTLQKKRIPADYKFVSTNRHRQKDNECLLWKNSSEIREKVKSFLKNEFDYYNYCDRCLGSSNDIFAAV